MPNKAQLAIRELSRARLEDPAYVASLTKRLRDGRAPHMETLLHHYAYGKPVEQVTGTLTVTHKVYAWLDQ